jgi:hypothetical protein
MSHDNPDKTILRGGTVGTQDILDQAWSALGGPGAPPHAESAPAQAGECGPV